MLEEQIAGRGIRDPRVLRAMAQIPRHLFVPRELADLAYEDGPLPIGFLQTISQPYIVAKMTELLALDPDAVVLEVGTGSGYQTAVLASIARHVYSVELIPELAERAQDVLRTLGIENVTVTVGDGALGDPAHAPYDGVIVTAAPRQVPPALFEQLAVGGRMVIPVGADVQVLMLYEKAPDGAVAGVPIFDVRFVPMRGAADAQ
ncbi:MAG: protein-L-isoaspartate(D-aspartate) O-methyltransferase [Myxococcales bacterium]|nr:protein-L-isoaspartate(D-aspartate) O-methyltransferase [Myxococcales bacterium]MCB9651453.1 protein-L-isoaspartate(D-aspartate) O-methyltransferase [Deltaproteobacteria bacterium]